MSEEKTEFLTFMIKCDKCEKDFGLSLPAEAQNAAHIDYTCQKCNKLDDQGVINIYYRTGGNRINNITTGIKIERFLFRAGLVAFWTYIIIQFILRILGVT